MKNTLTRGNEILHGTTYPLNGDRPMLCIVTAITDTTATGYKVWDMATTKTQFTARRLTGQRIAVGQRVIFYRLASEYVVYVPSPGVLFIKDNGYGSGQECDHTGAIVPGSPTLPLVATDPAANFHGGTPPWKFGRVYPGWLLGNKYVVWMQGHGDTQKTLITGATTTGSEYVDLELDTDNSGKVVDFRALDLLAFCVYRDGASDDVFGTEYKAAAWTTPTAFGNNTASTSYENQLSSRSSKAIYIQRHSSNACSFFFDGTSWSSENTIAACANKTTQLGAAMGRNKAYLKYLRTVGATSCCSVLSYDVATAAYATPTDYNDVIYDSASPWGYNSAIVANRNDYCLVGQLTNDTYKRLVVLRGKDGVFESQFKTLDTALTGTTLTTFVCTINSDDKEFVVYNKSTGVWPGINFCYSSKLGAWTGPLTLYAGATNLGSTIYSNLAASKDYAAFVVARKPVHPGNTHAYVKYLSLATMTWAEFEIETNLASSYFYDAVACDEVGHIHVFHVRDTTVKHYICTNGSWDSGTTLADVSYNYPSTAEGFFRWHFSPSGRGLLTWSDSTDLFYKIWDGTAWSAAANLATGAWEGTSCIG